VLDTRFRRSRRLERFLATRVATVLACVLALAALCGALVAAWRAEWVDAGVRLALAAGFAAWPVARLHRPHPFFS
jgi:hypothetical protein